LNLKQQKSQLSKDFESWKKELSQNLQEQLQKEEKKMNEFERSVLKNIIMETLKEHSLIKESMKDYLSSMNLQNCIRNVSKFSEELKKKINIKLALRGVTLEQFCFEEEIDISNFNL